MPQLRAPLPLQGPVASTMTTHARRANGAAPDLGEVTGVHSHVNAMEPSTIATGLGLIASSTARTQSMMSLWWFEDSASLRCNFLFFYVFCVPR
mmetsp:Transcript_41386/g.97207  ORF Transcript_41386/g.97207 Transcript_41386/m.97207 type:complete len:94 (+) Transcript_41386:1086-1367(+)